MREISHNFMKMLPKDLAIFGKMVEGKVAQESGLFPNPTPSIGQLSSTREALLDSMVNAKGGGIVQRQDRNAIEAQYKQELLQLSLYVSMATGNSVALMERSGYTITKERVKPVIPEAVSNLKTYIPRFSGEMGLTWNTVLGAHSFLIQYKEEGAEHWATNSCTKCTAIVSFLEPYKKYIFRVAAVGSAGQGPWSLEVPSFVL